MTTPLVRAQSSLEYFKQEVETACERQSLHPQALTSYYLVSLLSDFTHVDGSPAAGALTSNEALGLRFVRALNSGGSTQRQWLRQVGDVSLFVSGFFSDSLRACPVDVDYYMSLGGSAYGSLGNTGDVLSPVFAELSDKFSLFVDVLGEVSQRTSLTNDADLLRLYEKWVRTGSRRNAELLAERGIVPNAAAVAGARRVQ